MTQPLARVNVRLSVVVHTVPIEVVTDHRSVVDALASRLHSFGPVIGGVAGEPTGSSVDDRSIVTFDIASGTGPPLELPPSARTVYDSDLGPVWYVDDDDRLLFDTDGVRLDARLSEGQVTVRYDRADDDRLALVTHPLFTLSLLEIMKRRGRFPLHASCVGRPGADLGAILFPGPSGSGKSTLSVALSRDGWQFVADDMVFLQADERGVAVLGFPDEIDLTDASVSRFPELSYLAGRSTWGHRPKHQVRIDLDLGREPLLWCRPGALLFPRLSGRLGTIVEPLSADDALLELAPNVLLTDAAASQRHLDVLAVLVRTVPTAVLHVGSDLADAADVVARFAEERA